MIAPNQGVTDSPYEVSLRVILYLSGVLLCQKWQNFLFSNPLEILNFVFVNVEVRVLKVSLDKETVIDYSLGHKKIITLIFSPGGITFGRIIDLSHEVDVLNLSQVTPEFELYSSSQGSFRSYDIKNLSRTHLGDFSRPSRPHYTKGGCSSCWSRAKGK